ncbi:hypothetical protein TRFO_38198 [Tritrichomonas foetus]|uniref:Myb-like DNA-binding domain containing protein n=1 Tax=Tritrichomonas foetus TaxID=1144522 RepID=A0A1J4J904_9EUKA|nr:hypothetical protein TRFO_38198 [Tritrichomonas foetus]|eukprot:OHS95662.1 hypothetical protein TRFO_38198 [Tritrichomonas foetus]
MFSKTVNLKISQKIQLHFIHQLFHQIMSYNQLSHRSIRRSFSQHEDELLRTLVEEHGDADWKIIADNMKTRTARQCRERYRNYLMPGLVNGPWTEEEDILLKSKFIEIGAKWTVIATFFPTRSEINLKNRWAALSKRGGYSYAISNYAFTNGAFRASIPEFTNNNIPNYYNVSFFPQYMNKTDYQDEKSAFPSLKPFADAYLEHQQVNNENLPEETEGRCEIDDAETKSESDDPDIFPLPLTKDEEKIISAIEQNLCSFDFSIPNCSVSFGFF